MTRTLLLASRFIVSSLSSPSSLPCQGTKFSKKQNDSEERPFYFSSPPLSHNADSHPQVEEDERASLYVCCLLKPVLPSLMLSSQSTVLPHSKRQVDIEAFVSLNTLFKLRVVNGAFVHLRNLNDPAKHVIVRLFALQPQTQIENDSIYLSPSVIHSLDLPLLPSSNSHSNSNLSKVHLSRFKHTSFHLPIAQRCVLKRIITSIDQENDKLIDKNLTKYFEVDRVLEINSVVCVPFDSAECYNDHANDDENEDEIVLNKNFQLPNSTKLIFFRVVSLMHHNLKGELPYARVSTAHTTLIQNGSIQTIAPLQMQVFLHRLHASTEVQTLNKSISNDPTHKPVHDLLISIKSLLPPLSLLLIGPAMSGKRTSAHSTASILGITVVEIDLFKLFADSSNEFSSILIDKVRQILERVKPVVIYLRQLSLLMSHFSVSNQPAIHKSILHQLKSSLELINKTSNVALIASARDEQSLEGQIKSFFVSFHRVEALGVEQRKSLLRELIDEFLEIEVEDDDSESLIDVPSSSPNYPSERLLNIFASKTAGHTSNQLRSIVRDSIRCSFERQFADFSLVKRNKTLHTHLNPKSSIREETNGPEHARCQMNPSNSPSPNNSNPANSINCGSNKPKIRSSDLLLALKIYVDRNSSQTKSLLSSNPNTKWSDVGGLAHVKEEIMDIIELPKRFPNLFASGVKKRSGVLLWGPPGTVRHFQICRILFVLLCSCHGGADSYYFLAVLLSAICSPRAKPSSPKRWQRSPIFLSCRSRVQSS